MRPSCYSFIFIDLLNDLSCFVNNYSLSCNGSMIYLFLFEEKIVANDDMDFDSEKTDATCFCFYFVLCVRNRH